MSSMLLTEYRCPCGKLLFKGLVCLSIVEVKCRRCGAVTTWGLMEVMPYALVEGNADACMVEATGDIEQVLGHSRDRLIGRPLTDIFPRMRTMIDKCQTGGKTAPGYDLMHTTLMLHDREERPVKSCVVPRYANGSLVGYRVLAVPGHAPRA